MVRTILKLIELGAKKINDFDIKLVKELSKFEQQKGGKENENSQTAGSK